MVTALDMVMATIEVTTMVTIEVLLKGTTEDIEPGSTMLTRIKELG
jgi:hypothetical protein